MTGSKGVTMQEGQPDAYIILHDGQAAIDLGYETELVPYALGPYPPHRMLADMVMVASGCSCKRTVVPLFFPQSLTIGEPESSDEEPVH